MLKLLLPAFFIFVTAEGGPPSLHDLPMMSDFGVYAVSKKDSSQYLLFRQDGQGACELKLVDFDDQSSFEKESFRERLFFKSDEGNRYGCKESWADKKKEREDIFKKWDLELVSKNIVKAQDGYIGLVIETEKARDFPPIEGDFYDEETQTESEQGDEIQWLKKITYNGQVIYSGDNPDVRVGKTLALSDEYLIFPLNLMAGSTGDLERSTFLAVKISVPPGVNFGEVPESLSLPKMKNSDGLKTGRPVKPK